jgi:hypothetical protein
MWMEKKLEGNELEFKPSLFVNYDGSNVPRYFTILKAIAGFMNTKFGYLWLA